MSALATTIRQLSGRLALLRAERERYQALCAAAYQLAGTVNAPVRFLDAFSDGANGEIEARQKTEDLLPVDPQETGAFPAWSDDNIVSMQAEIEQLHEDLQAAKLLAHANGEMFRAEKAERERLAEELRTPQYTHVETGRIGSLWANGLSREAAEEGFMNYPGALVTVYYGRKWTFANMAEFVSGPPFPLATD